MARQGWVAAETGPDQWRRLMVFDDGWVELPGLGRSLSEASAQLRRSVVHLAAVVVGLAAVYGLIRLLALIDDPPVWVQVVPFVLLIGVLVAGSVAVNQARRRRSRQASADAEQARDERRAGLRITREPGAPMFKRASSAEELAGWLAGETLVRAVEITDVHTELQDARHLVTVRLSSGAVRTYRSPDRANCPNSSEACVRPDERLSRMTG